MESEANKRERSVIKAPAIEALLLRGAHPVAHPVSDWCAVVAHVVPQQGPEPQGVYLDAFHNSQCSGRSAVSPMWRRTSCVSTRNTDG